MLTQNLQCLAVHDCTFRRSTGMPGEVIVLSLATSAGPCVPLLNVCSFVPHDPISLIWLTFFFSLHMQLIRTGHIVLVVGLVSAHFISRVLELVHFLFKIVWYDCLGWHSLQSGAHAIYQVSLWLFMVRRIAIYGNMYYYLWQLP
jgi:hypothetical protein